MKRYADPSEEYSGEPNFNHFVRIYFKGSGHKKLFLRGLESLGLRNQIRFRGKKAFFPKKTLPQIAHLREHSRVRSNQENIPD